MDCIAHYDSPLGRVTLGSDGQALTGLWFEGQAHFAEGLSVDAVEASLPIFDLTKRWLDIYFSGQTPDFTPLLRPRGTEFQQRVWAKLTEIAYGQSLTYGDLAARLRLSPAAARAVGGAIARNHVSLIITCHRVLGAGRRLTGYAGGLERKKRLLTLEGIGYREN